MLYPFSALLARMKYITRWSRREGTQAHRQPEFILFLSQQLRLPGSTRPLHGFLFSLPKRQKVGLF